MEGLWDCADLAGLFTRALSGKQSDILKLCQNPILRFKNFVECSLLNLQTKERAKDNVKAHYDLGNNDFTNKGTLSVYAVRFWPKFCHQLQNLINVKFETDIISQWFRLV